jgi:hypothetical protein
LATPSGGPARGRIEDAIAAYELCALANPGDPLRAAPDLARLADQLAGTPAGEWARGELLEIKSWGRGPESPTA